MTGELRRELGLREAIAIGVGGTIGGGIFVLVGAAVGAAGPAALLAFLLGFVASLVIALPYAELACRVPLAGGGYAFARVALGPSWGFVMGWIYWGAYLALSGYVTIGFGGYLAEVTGLPVPAGAVALVTVCTLVNLLRVKISGQLQSLAIVTAVAGLIGLAIWGMPHVRLHHFTPFFTDAGSGLYLAALMAFLSFGGFDMVAAAGEEIKRPERNLPRAIVGTLLLVLVLYSAVTFMSIGVLSPERLGASSAPLAEVARMVAGPVGAVVIVACALLTTAATTNAIVVVTSRVIFAMARDRLMPRPFGSVWQRTGSPWVAVLGSGAIMCAIAAAGTVRASSSVGGFLYVLHFVPPLIALVVLRRRHDGQRPVFVTPLATAVIPLAFVVCTAMLAFSGLTGLAIGGTWTAAGLVIMAAQRRTTRRAAAPSPAAEAALADGIPSAPSPAAVSPAAVTEAEKPLPADPMSDTSP